MVNGSTDSIGGGAVFVSSQDFLALTQAIMVGDPKLFKEKSYEELLESQLSHSSKQALQALLHNDSGLYWELGGNIPLAGQKIWSLSGILSLYKCDGWMGKNNFLWQGQGMRARPKTL